MGRFGLLPQLGLECMQTYKLTRKKDKGGEPNLIFYLHDDVISCCFKAKICGEGDNNF